MKTKESTAVTTTAQKNTQKNTQKKSTVVTTTAQKKNTVKSSTTANSEKAISAEHKATASEVAQNQRDASEERHDKLLLLESTVKELKLKINAKNNAHHTFSESATEICYKKNNMSLYIKCKAMCNKEEMLELHKRYTTTSENIYKAVIMTKQNKDFRKSDDFCNRHRIRLCADTTSADSETYHEMLRAVKELEAIQKDIVKNRKKEA